LNFSQQGDGTFTKKKKGSKKSATEMVNTTKCFPGEKFKKSGEKKERSFAHSSFHLLLGGGGGGGIFLLRLVKIEKT